MQIGSYELVRRLGTGGMAETFVALRRGHGGFEQRVCLKRILPALESDAEFVRLFLQEARLAARLRHANIVQVIDFGLVDGAHFLTLELVEGLDLKALLAVLRAKGETLTSGLVTYLAVELATALDFAHRSEGRGIVHRDVSPSNVLLSQAGEVKLTDFGIAKAMTNTGVTNSGTIKGKIPYLAPEYASLGEFDTRSDLFSLGVTLYEALAGKRPFDGVTEFDTLKRIEDGRHVPIQHLVPNAPPPLVDAIERLIARDPAHRFPNAASLLDALEDVAPPPTARRILGELVRTAAAELPAAPPIDAPAATAGTIRTESATAMAPPTPMAPVAGPHDPTRTLAHEPGTRGEPTERTQTEAREERGETPGTGAPRSSHRWRRTVGLVLLGSGILLASAAITFWIGTHDDTHADRPAPASEP